MGTLVLITGTGRSGTSTMSGTLHHLGLHVPGPHLGANESNPKGFFESSWAVNFHKRITKRARINDFDSRPGAFARAQDALTPALRADLVAFLREVTAGHEQVVVKDPRSVWAQRLWQECAGEVGFDIAYISMLRHPAEVVGSRTTYYANPDDEAKRRSYETFNVARWINNSILSERETRGSRRAFVSYVELLEDWRPALVRLGDELGLTFDVDVAAGEASPVEEFIDPGLRRHQPTWDDLQVPTELAVIAEDIWQCLVALAAAGGTDAELSARMDALGERYEQVFTQAADIAHDAVEEARAEARAKALAEQQAAGSSSPKPSPQQAPKQTPQKTPRQTRPRSRAETPAGQLGSKDLLREVGGRVKRRLARG